MVDALFPLGLLCQKMQQYFKALVIFHRVALYFGLFSFRISHHIHIFIVELRFRCFMAHVDYTQSNNSQIQKKLKL